MYLKTLLSFGIFFMALCSGGGSAEPLSAPLIPMPVSVNTKSEPEFVINPKTTIQCETPLLDTAKQLVKILTPAGIDGSAINSCEKIGSEIPENSIVLKIDAAKITVEDGYSIDVNSKSIVITGGAPSGVFYGIQTIRQILPPAIENQKTLPENSVKVPAMFIQDQPALGWRGLMLDCSRHFMDVPTLKKMLDTMAFLKMNRFHWHLIDGNGWRLQIDKYPLLTETGAWRGPANARYGGFYTKKDVKEIVAYAKALHIEVIPEFEMPGHSDAAMMAYPEYSCLGTPYTFYDANGKPTDYDSLKWFNCSSRPFCAGNDKCFKFIEDVFDEALELFPYNVWHVGGDERPEGQWDKCPKCKERMKTLNLTDEHALQLWFMQQVSNILAKKGKTCISWAISTGNRYYDPQDLDNLGNGAILMNWHGSTHFAARNDLKIVNAACSSMYLDYPPFPMYPGFQRPKWMTFMPLTRVYSFDPIPAGITREQALNVIGAETCIWTEFIPQDELFQWVFPRVIAAAETHWLPAAKRQDVENFITRVNKIEERFARLGIAFAHPVPNGNTGEELRKE